MILSNSCQRQWVQQQKFESLLLLITIHPYIPIGHPNYNVIQLFLIKLKNGLVISHRSQPTDQPMSVAGLSAASQSEEVDFALAQAEAAADAAEVTQLDEKIVMADPA